jgi:hypothetical protein
VAGGGVGGCEVVKGHFLIGAPISAKRCAELHLLEARRRVCTRRCESTKALVDSGLGREFRFQRISLSSGALAALRATQRRAFALAMIYVI